MKKYRAIVNSHGFLRRYWERGQIVEVEDDVIPPKHFELLQEEIVEEKEEVEKPIALSQLINKEPVKVGMGAGQEAPVDNAASIRKGRPKKS